MRGNGATLDHPTRGSRDRYMLIIRHEPEMILEQRAFARESDRDEAARSARELHGNDAVTIDFIRDYRGRSVVRVFL